MSRTSRRGFLGAAAVAGGSVAALTAEGALSSGEKAVAAPSRKCPPDPPAATIGRDDPRYLELSTRGYNGRHQANPECIRIVHSQQQIIDVVNDAIRRGKRIAVRSGGHCHEDFVDNASVQIIIDISEMNAVYFDKRYGAFSVEAGATLGQVYRTLYLGWGVTIPAGACPSVGVGGHIAGGGFGPLSRLHGLSVDHLYGVEIVVAGESRARALVATREKHDPNRDLWWAHTGGGGGNFGIVTRYLFRSPDAGRRTDPSNILPRPPALISSASVSWPWEKMSEEKVKRVMDNYGRWHLTDDGGTSPLDSSLTANHRAGGPITLYVTIDGTVSDPVKEIREFVQAINEDVGVIPGTDYFATSPWLRSTLSFETGVGSIPLRFKAKAAFMRRPWSDKQMGVIHNYLTEGPENYGAQIYLLGYGGRINSVPASATATPHRNSIMLGFYTIGWWDPAQDETWLASIRKLYRDVHGDTGGVPVPDHNNDGAYINYPDNDLQDPEWNSSGVPWHTLYYKDNYRRLQGIKSRWDPRNIFRHSQSITPGDWRPPGPATSPDSRSPADGIPKPVRYPRPVPPETVFDPRP